MIDEIYGLYLNEKLGVKSDRIIFSESVAANDTSELTLTNALNGASLKGDLASLNYFMTRYTIWSQNGIIEVEIKPDNESDNQIKTYALTKKTYSVFTPPKIIETDITIKLTNNQDVDDDVFLIVDIFKIDQGKVGELIDISKNILESPNNIDIQTLAIEKYTIYVTNLLKALITASGGNIPGEITQYIEAPPPPPRDLPPRDVACKRI